MCPWPPPGTEHTAHWWAASDSRWVSLAHRVGVAVLRRLPASRAGGDVRMRAFRVALHRGDGVECPVCGSRFRHFMARPGRANAECWTCGARERQRTLWLFLSRATEGAGLLDEAGSLLHVAPEPALAGLLRRRPGLHYVSCDLRSGAADLVIDLTDMTLHDASFDAIICSHVLEHVSDDRRAMRELHRVVRPGGWVLVVVPLEPGLRRTFEDSSVTDPADRRRLFRQAEHVRLYGLDVVDRLREAGFDTVHLRPSDWLGPEDIASFGLGRGDDLLVCRRA